MKQSLLLAAMVAIALSACSKQEEGVPAPTVQEQAKEAAQHAVEAVKEGAEAAKEGTANAVEATKEGAADALEATKEGASGKDE